MRHRFLVAGGMLAVVALAVVLVPATGRAGVSRYADVDDSNVFLNDIEWLADAGVTRGCNPPTNDMFCPSASVTREQMAAFMHRQAMYFDADDSGVVDDAEAVGGYAPWDLNAAYALNDEQLWEDFASPEWTVALELAIVPPGDGLVYLTGVIDYGSLDEFVHNLVAIVCTDSRCGPDNWGSDLATYPGGGSPLGAQVVTTAVLPVDGDGDVLRLWMRAPNLGPVHVVNRTLTALYVPFGFSVDCDADGVCETIVPGVEAEGSRSLPVID